MYVNYVMYFSFFFLIYSYNKFKIMKKDNSDQQTNEKIADIKNNWQ